MGKIINWILLLFIAFCVISLMANLSVDGFNGGHLVILAFIGGLGYLLYLRVIMEGFPDAFVSRGTGKTQTAPKSLRPLPLPSDAHDVLGCFCRIANRLDSVMTYCTYEGDAFLFGGMNPDGTGYVDFSYTKDWTLMGVFDDLGYDVPLNDSIDAIGWHIGGNGDDYIYLKSKKITGYSDWAGYNSLKEKGFDDNIIAHGWEGAIRATINNEWHRATITNCSVTVNQNTLSYHVRIKT